MASATRASSTHTIVSGHTAPMRPPQGGASAGAQKPVPSQHSEGTHCAVAGQAALGALSEQATPPPPVPAVPAPVAAVVAAVPDVPGPVAAVVAGVPALLPTDAPDDPAVVPAAVVVAAAPDDAVPVTAPFDVLSVAGVPQSQV